MSRDRDVYLHDLVEAADRIGDYESIAGHRVEGARQVRRPCTPKRVP